MLSEKTITAIVGASVLVFLYQRFNNQIVENFGMLPPQTVRVERVVEVPKTGDMYELPGTYQAMLNPREAGMVDYGANIRYKMPDQGNRADSMGTLGPVPTAIIKEGYQASSMMPISSASQVSAPDVFGEASVQPIIYDRWVFANQKDRQREGADFIRGDLPITPIAKGWFSPAANPQTALRDGALMVMGGLDNETSRNLIALKSAISAGAVNTGSGIKYSVQSSPYTTAAGGDIHVTRFP